MLKRNFYPPPGEPREHHLDEVGATQHFIEDKMTGGVVYSGAFLRKVKNEVKHSFL